MCRRWKKFERLCSTKWRRCNVGSPVDVSSIRIDKRYRRVDCSLDWKRSLDSNWKDRDEYTFNLSANTDRVNWKRAENTVSNRLENIDRHNSKRETRMPSQCVEENWSSWMEGEETDSMLDLLTKLCGVQFEGRESIWFQFVQTDVIDSTREEKRDSNVRYVTEFWLSRIKEEKLTRRAIRWRLSIELSGRERDSIAPSISKHGTTQLHERKVIGIFDVS